MIKYQHQNVPKCKKLQRTTPKLGRTELYAMTNKDLHDLVSLQFSLLYSLPNSLYSSHPGLLSQLSTNLFPPSSSELKVTLSLRILQWQTTSCFSGFTLNIPPLTIGPLLCHSYLASFFFIEFDKFKLNFLLFICYYIYV